MRGGRCVCQLSLFGKSRDCRGENKGNLQDHKKYSNPSPNAPRATGLRPLPINHTLLLDHFQGPRIGPVDKLRPKLSAAERPKIMFGSPLDAEKESRHAVVRICCDASAKNNGRPEPHPIFTRRPWGNLNSDPYLTAPHPSQSHT